MEQIASFLRSCSVFTYLNDEQIASLAQEALLVQHHMGETILEEGSPGEAFFLILSGRVRIIKKYPDGEPVTLGVLDKGDHFGETAILTGQPQNATVRAAADVSLLRIPADRMRARLVASPELTAHFKRYVENVGLRTFLRMFSPLGSVLPHSEIRGFIDRTRLVTYAAGQTIFKQGDPADNFYVVQSGRVRILRRQSDQTESVLADIGEGEFFGELGILDETTRYASAVGQTDVSLLAMPAADFLALVSKLPELRRWFDEVIAHYRRDESKVRMRLLEQAESQRRLPVAPSQPAAAEASPEPSAAVKTGPRHFPFIEQHDESDCGAACLAMICRHYGMHVGMARMRELANVTAQGSSLDNLAEAAETLGFRTRGLRASMQDLDELQAPFIAHWEGFHFVVVYRATPDRVFVADPGRGRLELPREKFAQGWTGISLLVEPTDHLRDLPPPPSSLSRFAQLVRPHAWLLGEIFLASLVLDLLGLAMPIFTQVTVDTVIVHRNYDILKILLGGMLLVAFFRAGITILRSLLVNHISMKVDLQLLIGFYNHLMKLPLGFYKKRRSGDLIARFAENIRIRTLLTSEAVTVVLNCTMVVVYAVLMAWYHWKLALLAFSLLPLFLLLWLIFVPRMKWIHRQSLVANAEQNAALVESITNVETVKSLAAERVMRWKWEELFARSLLFSFRGVKLNITANAISGFLGALGSVAVLWYGAILVMRGELSLGQLMAFTVLVGNVFGPISDLFNFADNIQEAFISMERIGELLDEKVEEPPEEGEKIRLTSVQGHIQFKGVFFRYGSTGEPYVLQNLSFEITPGQHVAIVGRSGAGKTTIARLLLRLYQPTEGRVTIDGFDVKSVKAACLRELIGYVPQENVLFSGKIRENIAFKDPHPEMRRVIEAARMAGAHAFITSMPLGYDSVVGERGLTLSAGQRQRLCIARALYRDPQILVLDEATSALDTESESEIQANMSLILQKRTSIVIAHRLSTVRNADLILVLDGGRIVEQGRHDALMEQKGLYYHLCSQQLDA